MTEYEKTRYMLEDKAIEMAELFRNLEKEMDRVHKVNIYLIRKYREELLNEFKVDIEENNSIFTSLVGSVIDDNMKETMGIMYAYNKIAGIMTEEMPDPWYCYSMEQFNGTNKE